MCFLKIPTGRKRVYVERGGRHALPNQFSHKYNYPYIITAKFNFFYNFHHLQAKNSVTKFFKNFFFLFIILHVYLYNAEVRVSKNIYVLQIGRYDEGRKIYTYIHKGCDIMTGLSVNNSMSCNYQFVPTLELTIHLFTPLIYFSLFHIYLSKKKKHKRKKKKKHPHFHYYYSYVNQWPVGKIGLKYSRRVCYIFTFTWNKRDWRNNK